SKRKADGRLVDDTVQQELYQQIKQPGGNFQIPIEWGCVVPTHAGHPDSNLVKNGARYIFHTVAVRYEPGAKQDQDKIKPIDDGNIGEAVTNCLKQVMEVDKNRGVISPTDTETYKLEKEAEDNYKPIKSIIFPMFATGHGKRQNDIGTIGRLMLESIVQFVAENHNNADFHLESIHLCAYSRQVVETLEAKFREMKNVLRPVRSGSSGN
ncbi:MAG: hypothetical protein OIN84_15300, partial [Candidatus Methanoperedens sp.]|nr:hypothetical protein [Candidatus Methanoperedens sp.]